MKIAIAVVLMLAFLSPLVMAQGNRDLWSQENYIQSAKIQYKHVYLKTKLREDLYHCIDLIREAADRFGHRPELYFMLGTFYAEIHATDTMVAYFDSAQMFCDDQSIEAKYREKCYQKDKFVENMDKIRQDAWERSYSHGVEFLAQYDTVKSWLAPALTEDSAKVLDSLKTSAYNLALSDFETALLIKPSDPRSYEGLAVLLEREKHYQEAVDLYLKAVNILGENADLVNKIAYAYIYIPDWPKAIEWFEKYLKYEPEDINALINLSVAYSSINDYDKWYEYTTKVLALQPENTQFLFNAGQYWFLKMQEAAAELADIKDTTANAADRRKELDAKITEGRVNAEKYFEEIVRINPQDTDALKRLGIIYLLSQQDQKAATVFEEFVAIDSTDNDVLDFLGRSYVRLENTKAAIRPYEMITVNDPGNGEAWDKLAELYQYNGMPEKAKEARVKAEELKKL
jgi:tetratricopeptide (TPR) repeat protein